MPDHADGLVDYFGKTYVDARCLVDKYVVQEKQIYDFATAHRHFLLPKWKTIRRYK